MADRKARVHAVVRGRVQGVFFREETRRAAIGQGVAGWVRNRSDGTVEAVFEGKEKRVAAMLEWCKTGSPLSSVDRVDAEWEEYQGQFSEFSVRF